LKECHAHWGFIGLVFILVGPFNFRPEKLLVLQDELQQLDVDLCEHHVVGREVQCVHEIFVGKRVNVDHFGKTADEIPDEQNVAILCVRHAPLHKRHGTLAQRIRSRPILLRVFQPGVFDGKLDGC
jgi:hypothetical protein